MADLRTALCLAVAAVALLMAVAWGVTTVPA